MMVSGIAKGGPGWEHACPTHTKRLPTSLVCPVTGRYTLTTLKYSIKTVKSTIVPTNLAMPLMMELKGYYILQ